MCGCIYTLVHQVHAQAQIQVTDASIGNASIDAMALPRRHCVACFSAIALHVSAPIFWPSMHLYSLSLSLALSRSLPCAQQLCRRRSPGQNGRGTRHGQKGAPSNHSAPPMHLLRITPHGVAPGHRKTVGHRHSWDFWDGSPGPQLLTNTLISKTPTRATAVG